MGEVVTIGRATLIRGDCLEVMRDMIGGALPRADMLCTDPPYRVSKGGFASNLQLEGGFGGWMGRGYSNDGQVATCDLDWSDWLPLAFQALKDDCQAYVMSNGKSLYAAQGAAMAAGFDLHTVLVWDKGSALPNRWYQNITEFTLFMRKGRAFTIADPSSKNLTRLFQRDESEHPTEKPVELMALYIRNSTDPGGLVFDPFMGSGTTGVAAIRSGRRFIGCEIEQKWFGVACRRIERAQADFEMLGASSPFDAPRAVNQGDMFAAQDNPPPDKMPVSPLISGGIEGDEVWHA